MTAGHVAVYRFSSFDRATNRMTRDPRWATLAAIDHARALAIMDSRREIPAEHVDAQGYVRAPADGGWMLATPGPDDPARG